MSPNTVAQQQLLTSWKEIANYLGKGVRTVQRWEHQFGLPVRRPNAKDRGIVRADSNELDHWLKLQWSQRSGLNHNAVQPGVDELQSVRASIKQSAALRQANRALLESMHISLIGIHEECRNLTRNMMVTPRPN